VLTVAEVADLQSLIVHRANCTTTVSRDGGRFASGVGRACREVPGPRAKAIEMVTIHRHGFPFRRPA